MDQSPGRFPPPPERGPASPLPPQPGATIYPLDVGRVLDMTFSIFRFRWRAFVGAVLVFIIPVALLLAALQLATGDEVTRWYQDFLTAGAPSPEPLATFPWSSFVLGLLAGLVSGVGTYLASTTSVFLAAQTFTGARPAATSAVRASVARLGPIIGVNIVLLAAVFGIITLAAVTAGLLITAGSARAGFGPGPLVFVAIVVIVSAVAAVLFISVRWGLSSQGIMLEDDGAIAALGRSWRTVAGSTWRVLGYLLLIGLLVGVIGAGFSFAITVALNPQMFSLTGTIAAAMDPVRLALTTFATTVVTAVLLPIPAIALTLLYFDLRWRMGQPAPVPGQAPQP